MNERGKKLEPKLKLEMPFSEALERMLRVKPHDVEQSVKNSKTAQGAPNQADKQRKPRNGKR